MIPQITNTSTSAHCYDAIVSQDIRRNILVQITFIPYQGSNLFLILRVHQRDENRMYSEVLYLLRKPRTCIYRRGIQKYSAVSSMKHVWFCVPNSLEQFLVFTLVLETYSANDFLDPKQTSIQII